MRAAASSRQAETDELQVARVIYASQALVQVAVYSEMERIRAVAVEHNTPEQVSTALLYRSGWFLHWKEGPGAAVPRIMAQIAKDPRHHSSQIVHSSWGPRLLPGVWSMGILQSDEHAAEDMPARVAEVRREMAEGHQQDPATIWHRLAMPVPRQTRTPANASPPLPMQRILVCSAQGAQPFELVEYLSAKTGAGIVRGRLAGLDSQLGMAYVDCPQRHRCLRVVGLARQGLSVPLTRALLNQYSHLVLLLGTSDEDNRNLLDLVETACAGLTAPPALLGVGGAARGHSELLELAYRHGMACAHSAAPALPDSSHWWQAIESRLTARRRPAGAASRPPDDPQPDPS